MDEQEARLADRLTAEFYGRCGRSFSGTRHSRWPGWERLAPRLRSLGARAADEGRPLRVLDLGCGNLRFERWLSDLGLGCGLEVVAVDRDRTLVEEGDGGSCSVTFVEADLSRDWSPPAEWEGRFDVAVAFGLLHHLPRPAAREVVVGALARALAPGGMAAFSCWRFLEDERLTAKAKAATARALEAHPELMGQMGPGDAFLGWGCETDVFRFCHQVDEEELDQLVKVALAQVPAVDELERFSSDGRSGRLNRYGVMVCW